MEDATSNHMTAHNHQMEPDNESDEVTRYRELTELLVHDLRTPLSGLAGCITLIRKQLAPGSENAADEYLQMCDSFIATLSSRVSTLLDLTRLEGGVIPVEWAEHVVSNVVADAASIVSVDVSLIGARLTNRIPADCRGHFDRILVLRVLENLLANASRQVTEDGEIEVAADLCNSDLRITVRNDGRGIPPEERDKLFDRYYRVEARRDAARANRGLGLHFCRLAARAHGGDLHLVSADDGDVCFELRIPQAQQSR